MDSAVQTFLREQESLERSPHTLEGYTFTLRAFVRATPKAIGDVTADDIHDYLISLRRAGRSPGTIGLHYRHLRAFFNWCELRELIDRTPMYRMRAPRETAQVIVPYSDEEIARMTAGTSLRDQTLISVLRSTGIRKTELAGLRRDDVQGDRLLIRGKGRRERYVPLAGEVRVLLTVWLSRHQKASVFGLQPHSIYSVVWRLAQKAGVPNAHVHRFRDTFAVRYLERGGNIDNLQVLLGHANLNMTLRYVQYGRQQRALAEALRIAESVPAS